MRGDAAFGAILALDPTVQVGGRRVLLVLWLGVLEFVRYAVLHIVLHEGGTCNSFRWHLSIEYISQLHRPWRINEHRHPDGRTDIYFILFYMEGVLGVLGVLNSPGLVEERAHH